MTANFFCFQTLVPLKKKIQTTMPIHFLISMKCKIFVQLELNKCSATDFKGSRAAQLHLRHFFHLLSANNTSQMSIFLSTHSSAALIPVFALQKPRCVLFPWPINIVIT